MAALALLQKGRTGAAEHLIWEPVRENLLFGKFCSCIPALFAVNQGNLRVIRMVPTASPANRDKPGIHERWQ
jgi:hypothetical protein